MPAAERRREFAWQSVPSFAGSRRVWSDWGFKCGRIWSPADIASLRDDQIGVMRNDGTDKHGIFHVQGR